MVLVVITVEMTMAVEITMMVVIFVVVLMITIIAIIEHLLLLLCSGIVLSTLLSLFSVPTSIL